MKRMITVFLIAMTGLALTTCADSGNGTPDDTSMYTLSLYTTHGTTIPSGSVEVESGVATDIDATFDSAWYFDSWVVSSGNAYFDGDPTHVTSTIGPTTVTLADGDASITALCTYSP